MMTTSHLSHRRLAVQPSSPAVPVPRGGRGRRARVAATATAAAAASASTTTTWMMVASHSDDLGFRAHATRLSAALHRHHSRAHSVVEAVAVAVEDQGCLFFTHSSHARARRTGGPLDVTFEAGFWMSHVAAMDDGARAARCARGRGVDLWSMRVVSSSSSSVVVVALARYVGTRRRRVCVVARRDGVGGCRRRRRRERRRGVVGGVRARSSRRARVRARECVIE